MPAPRPPVDLAAALLLAWDTNERVNQLLLGAHEAHHRGQICLLARQLGRPLSQETNFGKWDWRRLALK